MIRQWSTCITDTREYRHVWRTRFLLTSTVYVHCLLWTRLRAPKHSRVHAFLLSWSLVYYGVRKFHRSHSMSFFSWKRDLRSHDHFHGVLLHCFNTSQANLLQLKSWSGRHWRDWFIVVVDDQTCSHRGEYMRRLLSSHWSRERVRLQLHRTQPRTLSIILQLPNAFFQETW